MPTRKYAEADYDRMAELREAGKTYGQIAQQFGCSIGLVSWTCLRLGALPPGGSKRNLNVLADVQRGNHRVRAFTPDEDRQLLALEREGHSYSEIGRRIGRKRNSVHGRLLTLARHEEIGGASS